MEDKTLLSAANEDLGTLSISRGVNCLATEVDGEVILLDLDSDIFIGLDEVGSSIWNLLETPATFSSLCQTLQKEYDVTETTCRADVLSFLSELLNDGLITIKPTSAL